MLYKDEYVSGNDVRIDPADPNIVYAALWQQQQGFSRTARSAARRSRTAAASSSRPTAARRGSQLTNGLPPVLEANLAIAPSNLESDLRDGRVHRSVHAARTGGGGRAGRRRPRRGGRGGGGGGAIGFYKTIDGGDHWFLATDDPRVAETGSQRHPPDTRPLGRIGGGDLPTITVDPKNENVVYSCSTVFWRTEDGGLTWSAVRGAPGGDDYQKSWVNPEQLRTSFCS